MKCIYYPGCSQKASSIGYEKSFLAISKKLGIEITELDDWNCCGTSAAISVNDLLSKVLSARNLAIAEPFKLPLVAPCPSCYISLKKTNKQFEENSVISEKINECLKEGGLHYSGKVEVLNILDFLVNTVGVEKINEKVTRPLTGKKIAPYYGCQIVSPYSTGDDNNQPENMEKIIKALGGEPVDFFYRTKCCGGSLMITNKKQAEKMSGEILKSADSTDADIVVTPCGLCQMNLESARGATHNHAGQKISLPILNITQLVGVALGIDKKELMINDKQFQKAILLENINN